MRNKERGRMYGLNIKTDNKDYLVSSSRIQLNVRGINANTSIKVLLYIKPYSRCKRKTTHYLCVYNFTLYFLFLPNKILKYKVINVAIYTFIQYVT